MDHIFNALITIFKYKKCKKKLTLTTTRSMDIHPVFCAG